MAFIDELTRQIQNRQGANNLPIQTVSFKEKQSDTFRKLCLDYFDAAFMSGAIRRKNKLVNYRLYNGQFDFKDYEYAAKPFGEEFGDMPAELRHYPIITNPIEKLIGEERKRPFNWKAKDESEGSTNEFIRAQTEMLFNYAKSELSKELQIDLNTPKGLQMAPPEIQDYFTRKFSTTTEKTANKLCTLLLKKENVLEKFVKGWKDAKIVGEEIYWIGTINDEPVLECVNPVSIVFDKSQDIDFLDQAEWVCRGEYMAPSQIIDRYRKYLSEDEVKNIEAYDPANTNKNNTISTDYGVNSIVTGNNFQTDIDWTLVPVTAWGGTGAGGYDDVRYPLDPQGLVYDFFTTGQNNNYMAMLRHIKVIHAEWMSKRKIGELTFIDELGLAQKMIVDENYKVDKENGEEVEWFWINEVWEGTKIGKNIYVKIEPKKNQNKAPDDLYGAKLGYTGYIYNARNAIPVSTLDRMKNFQILYNIFMRKLEEDMNSELGQIMLMSLSQIPNSKNWNLQRWLYYVRTMKIAFIEDDPDRNKSGFNQFSVLNASLANAIEQKVRILDYLYNQCAMMGGVVPQSMGQTSPQESATGTQQAVYQSAILTENDAALHNQIKGRVLTNLLEEAKVAYNRGWKTTYFLDDLSRDFLEIDANFTMAKLNVYVTDSEKDNKVLETLKGLAQPAMQNGATLGDIATLLTEDSISELKEKLAKIDAAHAQVQQAEQQLEQQTLQQKIKEFEETRQDNNVNAQLDRDNQIQIAEIKALGMEQTTPDNTLIEQSNLALETSKHLYERTVKDRELSLKEKEITDKKQLKTKELTLKEKDIKAKETDTKIRAKAEKEKNLSNERIARISARSKNKPK